jgi:Asp-tRNA(Asn)/Glu-tRNA(Gln) amidotransferase A subunit family amidase
MVDLAFRSVTALLSALENKETSSEELLKHYLSRIERLGGTFHAVVTSKGAARSTASR